jgi:hypothetical protein
MARPVPKSRRRNTAETASGEFMFPSTRPLIYQPAVIGAQVVVAGIGLGERYDLDSDIIFILHTYNYMQIVYLSRSEHACGIAAICGYSNRSS